MLLNLFWFRPSFLFDGDSGGAGGGSTDTNPDKDKGGDGAGGGEATRTFKQSELDALFAERAKQGKQSGVAELLKELGVENVDALKTAQKAAKEAADAQLTELQKAQKEAADNKALAEASEKEKADITAKAQEKLLRAAILAEAAKQGFNDPNDAWLYVDRTAIKAKDDDTFEGIDKALEAVVSAKPYLVEKQQQSSQRGTPKREKGKQPATPAGEGEQSKRKSLARF